MAFVLRQSYNSATMQAAASLVACVQSYETYHNYWKLLISLGMGPAHKAA